MIENNNLKKKNRSDISNSNKNKNKAWDKDNQAWWDWYVTLADNSNTKDALLEL